MASANVHASGGAHGTARPSFWNTLFGPGMKWAVIAALIALVVGCIAWVMQLTQGLLQTSGMSNTFNWGLMIAVFAFLVGFGAGSQFVASYIVLANRQDLMPYLKIAQSVALAGAIGAGVAIMIDLGNPQHIAAMLLAPNPTSPLTWDMISLTAFIIVAFINVILVGRQAKSLKAWMVIGLIAAFALQLVEGLLFALMESRIWWHSVIMPVDFIVVALVCGLAMAAIVMGVQARRDIGKYSQAALKHVGKLLIWAVVIHLALALIDLFLVISQGTAGSSAVLQALGGTWYLYAAELVLPAVAAIVVAAGMNKDLAKYLIVAGVLVVIGIFCHRLMLLYPAFGAPTLFVPLSNEPSPAWALPASTGQYTLVGQAFEIAQGYMPAPVEWISTLLPLGLALGVYAVAYSIAASLASHKE